MDIEETRASLLAHEGITEREISRGKEIIRLRVAHTKLQEAFMEYGKHHSSCILEHHAPGVRDCGCGFVGILREIAGLP